MFNFGNANSEQREAITAADGPVLIIAGPGTGKTYTLVQRILYLIQERGVKPENILISTFTDKAARELVTRISNELLTKGLMLNLNDMYVGTFHSICLRIIKEHLEYTSLGKNYRMLDPFDQSYIVFQNFYKFKELGGFEFLFGNLSNWEASGLICKYVNTLAEELIEPEALIADEDFLISSLGRVFKFYKDLMRENSLLDFSSMLTEAYNLLKNNQDVLKELQAKITHIMIDEYQDTNTVQEQLVMLLAGKKQNICVVGDDDQGLYRFRGAAIRNILQFPSNFEQCKVIKLVKNYRSDSGIIDFYNNWMETTSGYNFRFDWDDFRYEKTIEPREQSSLKSPTAVKLSSVNDFDKWHEKILNFINKLKESKKLTDYNQIAFLCRSVTNEKIVNLANFLEAHGVNVYAPRSNMFFNRYEVKLTLGCLMLMFPSYVQELSERFDLIGCDDDIARELCKGLKDYHVEYYISCIKLANEILIKPENKKLAKLINSRGKAHLNLTNNADYAYSGLLYQLFEFKPFADILSTELNSGVIDVRPVRNLAAMTQIIGKFEYLHDISVLNAKFIEQDTNKLFNLYLKLVFDGGMGEYEDDSEYAPSGCVSFMTIHQAKGLEFPIVIVDSLNSRPADKNDFLMAKIEPRYFKRKAFEPKDKIKFFDFWRLYYTAFSRAQDLLVLTCNEIYRGSWQTPSKYFKDIYNELPSVESKNFDVNEFNFKAVKDINIKNSYSFTKHITLYETCALQYKFYRELEFMPVRAGAMLFGLLVHQTIEDVHKAVLKGEEFKINKENISAWLDANYISLSQSNKSYLSKPLIKSALNHVMNYVEAQSGDWSKIKQAEVDVSLVKPDYIIDGKIDLIRGDDDTVEIIDFKSMPKPDVNDPKAKKILEHYKKQLHIYAHLVEQRTGNKVSMMRIYYTGEKNSVPTISYKYSPDAVQNTMQAFDETVKRIMNKDFSNKCSDNKICQSCDFRHYCKINY
ncbi:MAG: ATP-dependent helicase [Synergistaceae bacterium]|nr:ATP-dependent helicase [Synergistaceae bacterium]